MKKDSIEYTLDKPDVVYDGYFTKIPGRTSGIYNLPSPAFKLYCWLLTHENGYKFTSYFIRKGLTMDYRTLKKNLKVLQESNLLVVSHTSNSPTISISTINSNSTTNSISTINSNSTTNSSKSTITDDSKSTTINSSNFTTTNGNSTTINNSKSTQEVYNTIDNKEEKEEDKISKEIKKEISEDLDLHAKHSIFFSGDNYNKLLSFHTKVVDEFKLNIGFSKLEKVIVYLFDDTYSKAAKRDIVDNADLNKQFHQLKLDKITKVYLQELLDKLRVNNIMQSKVNELSTKLCISNE